MTIGLNSVSLHSKKLLAFYKCYTDTRYWYQYTKYYSILDIVAEEIHVHVIC